MNDLGIDLKSLARALGGKTSNGQVLAPGPGHSSADRSLSVKLDNSAPDGFVVHSFSGNDPIACRDYVRQKLGLSAFKPNGRNHQNGVAASPLRNDKPKGRVVAEYDYTDANGELLYQVQRYEPKDFRQRQPDVFGDGWVWKLDDRRVLYRLPELIKFPDATVFICEGEKDADRVASLGHCATTLAGGSIWTQECIQALAGRDCIILQDNDDKGRERSLAAAQALHGTAKTVRVVALPDLPDKGDVSDWLDADPRRAAKLPDVCFDVPEWQPLATTPAPTASEALTPPAASKQDDSPKTLPFINVAAWQNAPAPEREWVVRNRVPLRNVTLLSGEGGVGKSILALHCAASTALGRDWLGTMPEPGAVLVVCCEDDEHELHRRLDRIAEHSGTDFTELSKNTHLISLAGDDAIMATPEKSGLIVPTTLFKQVRQAIYDIRPRLIVIDNSADVYAGNENDRAQVRQFITLLRGPTIDVGAGLILTSHPSLTGISTGTGLSGSTAWNASVRSRLYFKRATTAKDEEPDPDLRVLEVMKSNYGPVGEAITLRWKDGLFLPVNGTGGLDKLAAEQRSDEVFLTLLAQFESQGRNVSDKPTAPSYAPAMF
ncbi:MAG: AAA family ATPase, partial [Xanthobacteraceae bacterium]